MSTIVELALFCNMSLFFLEFKRTFGYPKIRQFSTNIEILQNFAKRVTDFLPNFAEMFRNICIHSANDSCHLLRNAETFASNSSITFLDKIFKKHFKLSENICKVNGLPASIWYFLRVNVRYSGKTL